jgi:hypothetical protein
MIFKHHPLSTIHDPHYRQGNASPGDREVGC